MLGILKEPLVSANVFEERKGMVIALGNFDGVHVGHSAIIGRTVALAKELSVNSAVWMFHPHPMECLTGKKQPLLTTFAERKEIFAQKGIEIAAVADFNAFRSMPPRDFLCFLRDELGLTDRREDAAMSGIWAQKVAAYYEERNAGKDNV